MKKEIVISIKKLVIKFKTRANVLTAIRNISFDIYDGETLAIVGESGSGKTTIGRAIAGFQAIKDGTVYINRRVLRGKPPQLYKINLHINEQFRLLKSNNMLLNKNLSNYINNLKLVIIAILKISTMWLVQRN